MPKLEIDLSIYIFMYFFFRSRRRLKLVFIQANSAPPDGRPRFAAYIFHHLKEKSYLGASNASKINIHAKTVYTSYT